MIEGDTIGELWKTIKSTPMPWKKQKVDKSFADKVLEDEKENTEEEKKETDKLVDDAQELVGDMLGKNNLLSNVLSFVLSLV